MLYNVDAGETGPGVSSPSDTAWAFGALANFNTLTYSSLESMRNGALGVLIVGKPMVMHLIKEDIYMSVVFKTWGQFGSGTVAYTRSTAAAAAPPPTVSLTSPSTGEVFAAPANVTLIANAAVTSGTVTNVTFLSNGAVIGSSRTPPFSITASNLLSGNYSVSAIATAQGLSATSTVVSVSVVTPVAVLLSGPRQTNGLFSFNGTVDLGLSYVVESSSNLVDWAPVSTNVVKSNPASFSDTFGPAAHRFYRVGRQPNP